jgi:hypothetical protein
MTDALMDSCDVAIVGAWNGRPRRGASRPESRSQHYADIRAAAIFPGLSGILLSGNHVFETPIDLAAIYIPAETTLSERRALIRRASVDPDD